MQITYESFGEYYIFSHDLNTRVYLGDASPEDYIHDELEQQKRSASYIPPKNKKDFNDLGTWTYDFKRRLSLGEMGNFTTNIKAKYNQNCKAAERLAWIWFLNTTPEEYDARQAQLQRERDERAREMPYLHNLMMYWKEGIGNVSYYVDDDGNEITFEQHQINMKAKYGDDVFELAAKNNPPSPEAKKFLEQYYAMKDMSMEEKVNYMTKVNLDDFE